MCTSYTNCDAYTIILFKRQSHLEKWLPVGDKISTYNKYVYHHQNQRCRVVSLEHSDETSCMEEL